MIQMNFEMVSTRYCGYFWDTSNHKLYSCKSGKLREMKKSSAFCGRIHGKRVSIDEGYRVSHLGVRRFLSIVYLMKLKATTDVEFFPMGEKMKNVRK